METATRIVSRVVDSHLSVMAEKLASAPSVEQWLDELFAFWVEPLESSEYRLGSFMMAAALDELDPAVQSAAGQAFTDGPPGSPTAWSRPASTAAARSMAGLLLSVIEGAIVQARALESSQPFADAQAQLGLLLGHHLTPR